MSIPGVSSLCPAGLSWDVTAAAYAHNAGADVVTPGCKFAELVGDLPITHQRWKPGDYLFRAGDDFHSFHVLNAGFAKTCYMAEDGREQTTGLYLRGDILGLDAVATGTHDNDAVTLDECEVQVIPYDAVIEHGLGNPDLLRELHRAFSAEIRSDRDLTLSRARLSAEGRLAAFLLDMSFRFASRGLSATELPLHLSRQEIGSLLGLKLDTVSRAFSRLAKLGLITVYLRDIVLLDRDGLLDLIAQAAGPERASRKSSMPGTICQFRGAP